MTNDEKTSVVFLCTNTQFLFPMVSGFSAFVSASNIYLEKTAVFIWCGRTALSGILAALLNVSCIYTDTSKQY